MLCNKARKRLSEYFDEALDSKSSIEISRHLEKCTACSDELAGLSMLHERLKSIDKLQVPDYAYHLIQVVLGNKTKRTRFGRLKDAVELRWFRIRTAGIQFYWTKALGTVMAAFCLCVISSGIDPFYPSGYVYPVPGQYMTQEYRTQVRSAISKSFGRFPIEQFQKNSRHNPAINPQYFNNYWDSVPETVGKEDLSIVTTVEPSGTVKIENVLEYPEDKSLLDGLNIFDSARGRPGSRNGKSISLPMVLKFSRLTVFGSAE
jgi:hypothetical protein